MTACQFYASINHGCKWALTTELRVNIIVFCHSDFVLFFLCRPYVFSFSFMSFHTNRYILNPADWLKCHEHKMANKWHHAAALEIGRIDLAWKYFVGSWSSNIFRSEKNTKFLGTFRMEHYIFDTLSNRALEFMWVMI